MSLTIFPTTKWTLPSFGSSQQQTHLDDPTYLKALKAHSLLSSIHTRHQHLGRFLQEYNAFKANPLCGAMCQTLEDKIHQMALLIRGQQTELKQIIAEYDSGLVRSESTSSRVSSFEQLAELEEMEERRGNLPELSLEPAPTNWMASNRAMVLREVVSFSTDELPHIEKSRMLEKYPPLPAGARSRTPSLFSHSPPSSSSSSFSAIM
ncbi:hypothetical protein GGI15_001812 [Coemansia interrupta]|uniref:Uncharacterized protein n=1 Tax=Coemansia interrupta TaxID=1126814 RepID=A0A9W8HK07_9FUNG|nr:hypothetical protein GGI15_001812 [Coemansia interrupta]